MVVVSMIGVFLAFPMKRRFINGEQLPFPEGRACGVVLDALYTGAAAAMEIARLATKCRFPLSAVAVGLGVVLPPEATFAMWVGAMIFWLAGRKHATPGTKGHTFWVDGCEPICAGPISGAALMGIGNAIVNVLPG